MMFSFNKIFPTIWISMLLILFGIYTLKATPFPEQLYRFKSITVNDNLSHSDATCVVQDSMGYIWIGTNNGLNRFDGYRVTTFKANLEVSNSMPGNRVKFMLVDQLGYIWIALENIGLYRFHPSNMHFEEISLPYPNTQIQDLLISPSGHIWINKGNLGLCRILLTEEGNIQQIIPYSGATIGGTGDFSGITQTAFYQQKLFFANTNQEIWTFESDKNAFKQLTGPKDLLQNQTETISELYGTKEGLWIGTNHRLAKLENGSDRTTLKTVLTLSNYFPRQSSINHLLQDHLGRIWMSTGFGLAMVDLDIKPYRLIRYHEDMLPPFKVNRNQITGIIQDNYGVLWVASGGVNYTNLRRKTFHHLLQKGHVQDHLTDRTVSAIYKQPNGPLWIGTRAGLSIYEPTSEKYHFFRENSVAHFLGNANISCIVSDSKNRIWISARHGGLHSISFDGKKLSTKKIPFIPEVGPGGDDIMRITEAKDGKLWLSTFMQGIIIFDPESGDIQQLVHDPANSNSLSSNKLTDVYCDPKDGAMWVSTRDGGLNQVKKGSNGKWKIQRFFYQPGKPNTISSNHTWQIYRTQKGELWVATLGGGFNKIIEHPDGNYSFQRFTDEHGLVDNDIECLLEDLDGNLWLGGVGLTRFNPVTVTFEHFDYQDGLQSNAFKVGACFRDTQGLLYFGGINGLNYFDPREIVVDPIVPQVYITQLKVSSKRVETGSLFNGRILVPDGLHTGSKIKLKADENDIVLEFVGLQFTSPQKNQYKYKLEGLDDHWNTTQFPNLSANYSNIPPGDYVFKVKASNGDGVWNEQITELSIHIAKPWYATAFAFLLYGAIAAGALLLFRQNTVKQARLKNELLLAEKEQELSHSKLSFFTKISHELRSPLTLIKGPLEELLVQPKISRQIKDKLLVMQNSANRLLHLMNQLLDFRKMETGNMRLQAAEGNFVRFLEELFLIFSQSAGGKNIQYAFESPLKDIPLYYDRDKMEIVIMNLLSNAYKYTGEGGRIDLTLSIHGDPQEDAVFTLDQQNYLHQHYLQLDIRDNGIGLSAKELEKIFDPYYQVKSVNTMSLVGTGIGLSLVKGIVDLHNGEVSVHSKEGRGSVFSIRLPFGAAHLRPQDIIPNFQNSEFLGHYTYVPGDDFPDIKVTPSGIDYLQNIEERTHAYRVLIVEDNSELRSYLRELLEQDFWVEEAGNGQEGLEMILNHPPDLIISDVMMPVMDGIRLCKRIKETELIAHIPVILLTARTSTVYEMEGLETGAEAYITKPFNAAKLKAKMSSILKNRERQREYYRKQLFFEPVQEHQLSAEEKLVHQAIELIENQLENPEFNVQKLSEGLCLSQSSLYRKVKTVTDKSLVEFIRDVRLRKAAQLIQEGELTIKEIAYKVGFSSPKYFRQCFKRLYGKNPSELLKEEGEMEY